MFVLAVQDFVNKNVNKQLVAQINIAFDDCPDSEEEMLQDKMRNKQFNNLERESW